LSLTHTKEAIAAMTTTFRRPATSPRSPISAAEVAATRQPTERAHTLPARVYHDPEVFAFEQEQWFTREWLFVGREEDLPQTGSYFLTRVVGENIVLVRGNDGVVRAFHNVCRHRGSTMLEEQCGQLVRFQCPYHAWIYDLQGRLRPPRHTETLENFSTEENSLFPVQLATWQGMLFLNLAADAPPFSEHIGEFPSHFDRFPLSELKRAKRLEYDVEANWKALMENYAECYHCPGVHPLLNHLTPYDLGGYLPGVGQWAASWMELVGEAETLSIDGHLNGRLPIPGMTEADLRRVYYAWIWPNMLFSLHPDYLMTHQVWPVDAEHSQVVCELYFHPETMAQPDFDASGPSEFWDLTNRQDWHVCQLQQAGTRSRAYTPGRYSAIERMVHSFDAKVADRYADDGVTTAVVRPPKKEWSAARAKRAGVEERRSAD
jgi:Rieske 2Fe-2S family protein